MNEDQLSDHELERVRSMLLQFDRAQWFRGQLKMLGVVALAMPAAVLAALQVWGWFKGVPHP